MLAERTGTTVPTIRYYEQIGLLRPAARSGGQRTYDNEDVRRLAFVRRCRDFDFSIEEVLGLLSLLRDRKSCTDARNMAVYAHYYVRQNHLLLKHLTLPHA